MSYFLDYKFDGAKIANPNGTLPTTLPADAIIGAGPGSFRGQELPKSVRVGSSGAISINIQSITIPGQDRFHVSVVFKVDSIFTGRQRLVESNRLPFAVDINGAGGAVKALASVKTSAWRGIDVIDSPVLTSGTWHLLQLVYDVDTLFLFLDGSAAGCHSFGPNGDVVPVPNATTIDVGGLIRGQRFVGQIASLRVGFGTIASLDDAMDRMRLSPQWFITSKLEAKRPTTNLGEATNIATFNVTTAAWSQTYTSGVIMYHSAVNSAFIMYGVIYRRYLALPVAKQNELGYLATDEEPSRLSGARKSLFQGGGIYWSSSTGAFEITGQMYLYYEATGEAQAWGLPIAAEQAEPGGESQRLQRATIFYRTGAPTAHIIIPSILTTYLRRGGPQSWGFPLTDELVVRGVKDGATERNVRVVNFEGCDIYWSPPTGVRLIYGDIRKKWLDLGGPTSPLGLPITDEVDVPSGGRMSGFERGVITWYGSWDSIVICRPFNFFIGNLNTRESEDWLMGENDLYFHATINEANNTIFRQRYPSSGDFGGHNTKDVNIPLPVLNPAVGKEFTVVIDIWDADPGNDDHLGVWTIPLNAANSWGLREHQGIFNSGRFSKINNISASVQPQVEVSSLTSLEKFWGTSNRGTPVIDYQTYAQAFRDVDSSPEDWDPLDWLDKAFYEIAAKGLAANGNCFGMSLEAIYSWKRTSLFGLPINRFTDWNVLRPVFNVKHEYQIGAAAIWWFVGQFLSGNTHDPVDVFNETRNEFNKGNNPILCISQNYDFSGAPHCIYPFAWDSSSNPWKITVHDPNQPRGITRVLEVDNTKNTWKYSGSSNYSGGAWSGGRLHYLPWSVLNSTPRTPVWDAILLLLAGTIMIVGTDAETTKITSPSGANLDAHSAEATEALKNKRSLDGHFANAPIMMGDGNFAEIKFARGIGQTSRNILPMIPERSTVARAIRAADGKLAANLAAHISLEDLERRILGLTPAVSFKHTVKGKRAGGSLGQLVKSGTTTFSITSPLNQGETADVEVKALNTVNSEILTTHSRAKALEISVMHGEGLSQATAVKFNITTEAAGTIKLSPKPGLSLVDIENTAGKFKQAKMEVTTVLEGKPLTHQYDLLGPGQTTVDGRLRVKIPNRREAPAITISVLGRDGVNAGKILDSRILTGQKLEAGLGRFGPFDSIIKPILQQVIR